MSDPQASEQEPPLEASSEFPERDDLDEDERPVEWEPDYDEETAYDEETEFEPGHDDEDSEFEPDYDDESDFGPGFGPGEHPGHRPGPEPRLAPGRPPPPHQHGHGPKKTPGKKAPGKKAPGKKVPGPKKHPGHPPPPPHEHGLGHPPPPHEHDFKHGTGGPRTEPDFRLGPGAGFGVGPGPDFGWGFGFGPRPGGRRRGPSRRRRPGDVRAAILNLLAEGPMHGYEMIQEIAERSQDLWRPSPGSVYPALQLLDDEGLINSSEGQGNQRLYELTDQGRAAAEKIKSPPWEKIAESIDSGQANLREAVGQVVGAVAQSAYVLTAEGQQRIVAILKNARREIYTLLAESD